MGSSLPSSKNSSICFSFGITLFSTFIFLAPLSLN
jgi:hypothetical protein